MRDDVCVLQVRKTRWGGGWTQPRLQSHVGEPTGGQGPLPVALSPFPGTKQEQILQALGLQSLDEASSCEQKFAPELKASETGSNSKYCL